MPKRFDRCECGDTFGKHDDNGVCRVKDCICTEFVLEVDSGYANSSRGGFIVHRSFHGESAKPKAAISTT